MHFLRIEILNVAFRQSLVTRYSTNTSLQYSHKPGFHKFTLHFTPNHAILFTLISQIIIVFTKHLRYIGQNWSHVYFTSDALISKNVHYLWTVEWMDWFYRLAGTKDVMPYDYFVKLLHCVYETS